MMSSNDAWRRTEKCVERGVSPRALWYRETSRSMSGGKRCEGSAEMPNVVEWVVQLELVIHEVQCADSSTLFLAS